eukprot:755040-Hanusia_phi.AAC.3
MDQLSRLGDDPSIWAHVAGVPYRARASATSDTQCQSDSPGLPVKPAPPHHDDDHGHPGRGVPQCGDVPV